MRAWAIGAVVGALLLATAAAAQSPGLTSKDADRLPPDVLSHRAMALLADDLVPAPNGVFADLLPLSDLPFQTRPVGTAMANVCRRDTLRVEFRAAAPPRATPDTPARAIGLSVVHSFILLARPLYPDARVVTDQAVAQLDAECAGLAQNDLRFFSAPDAWNAGMGASAYLLAVEDAQLGGRFASDCEKGQAGCMAQLAAGGRLSEVHPCAPGSNSCWEVATVAAEFRIQLTTESKLAEIAMHPIYEIVVTSDEPRPRPAPSSRLP